MTATYDDTLPTDKDRARAILGDTNTASALLSDEHITAVLALEGSVSAGAAALADELIARFARDPVRITTGGDTVDFSGRLTAWQRIVATVRAQGGALSFIPISYGVDTDAEFASPPNYWP